MSQVSIWELSASKGEQVSCVLMFWRHITSHPLVFFSCCMLCRWADTHTHAVWRWCVWKFHMEGIYLVVWPSLSVVIWIYSAHILSCCFFKRTYPSPAFILGKSSINNEHIQCWYWIPGILDLSRIDIGLVRFQLWNVQYWYWMLYILVHYWNWICPVLKLYILHILHDNRGKIIANLSKGCPSLEFR